MHKRVIHVQYTFMCVVGDDSPEILLISGQIRLGDRCGPGFIMMIMSDVGCRAESQVSAVRTSTKNLYT